LRQPDGRLPRRPSGARTEQRGVGAITHATTIRGNITMLSERQQQMVALFEKHVGAELAGVLKEDGLDPGLEELVI
jgi:hypothetical protein